MNYLLDSSAWLVHMLGESGHETVSRLFDDEANSVSISVLSIVEVYARFVFLERVNEWSTVFASYEQLFTTIVPVSAEIAHQAITLRTNTPKRLPTIDALIAATAAHEQMMLVHRDPHLAAIPSNLVTQLQLAAKDS